MSRGRPLILRLWLWVFCPETMAAGQSGCNGHWHEIFYLRLSKVELGVVNFFYFRGYNVLHTPLLLQLEREDKWFCDSTELLVTILDFELESNYGIVCIRISRICTSRCVGVQVFVITTPWLRPSVCRASTTSTSAVWKSVMLAQRIRASGPATWKSSPGEWVRLIMF